MKLALLGSGHVGAALGTAWTICGHEVFFGVRDLAAAGMSETLGACAGRARAGTPAQTLAFAGVVVVALSWPSVEKVLGSLDIAGKIEIDCTNPPAGLDGASGRPVSGAELIAMKFPQVKVAKCFNITRANNMANPVYTQGPGAMFVYADDAEAKAASITLSSDAGFETYYAGALGNPPHGVAGAAVDLARLRRRAGP